MGLIRPMLKNNKANIILPICDTSNMNWIVRLILNDKAKKNYFVEFPLITHE